MTKIFIIGHNKSGTRMLHSAFTNAGYKSCHWDRGRLAQAIHRNISLCAPPLTGYDDYSVFSDMECILDFGSLEKKKIGYLYQPYKLFPLLAVHYPQSIFIYNRRRVDDWIISRLRHGNGYYAMVYLRLLITESQGMISSIEHLIEYWRREWRHHDDLVKEFSDSNPNRVYTLDIESMNVDAINDFLCHHSQPRLELKFVDSQIGRNLDEKPLDLEHLRMLASKVYDQYQSNYCSNSK